MLKECGFNLSNSLLTLLPSSPPPLFHTQHRHTMASSASPASAAATSSSSGTPQEQLEAMLRDPRYKQGVALTKLGKYDEALEFLGACVALVASEDDLSLAAAPVYFAYGDALLSKAEDSADLFGAAMKKAEEEGGGEDEDEDVGENMEPEGGMKPESGSSSSAAAASSSSGGGSGAEAQEEKEEKEEEEGEEATKVVIPEDVQDDLEVAWENLEAARVIYHKHEGVVDIDPKRIGEVYLRLGDLQKNNGNFSQAVEDYLRSLGIYGKVCGEDSRVIAELHYQLAMTYIYASGVGGGGGEGGGEGAVGLKKKALEHYERCARVFELLVSKAQADVATAGGRGGGEEEKGKGKASATTTPIKTSPAENLKEFTEILDELKETIEATKHEILAASDPMNEGERARTRAVTTVGFDAPSCSVAAAADAAVAGDGDGKGGGASSNGAVANVMMTVKKKVKPATAAPAAPAAPAPVEPEKKKEESVLVEEQKQQQLDKMEGKSSPKKRLATEQTEGPAEPPLAKEARAE